MLRKFDFLLTRFPSHYIQFVFIKLWAYGVGKQLRTLSSSKAMCLLQYWIGLPKSTAEVSLPTPHFLYATH